MALVSFYLEKEIRQLIHDAKSDIPEKELVSQYSAKLKEILISGKKDVLFQVLMNMYDNDTKKLKSDIAALTILNSWGGSRRKALSVIYPAMQTYLCGTDIIRKINDIIDLSLMETEEYDTTDLPFK